MMMNVSKMTLGTRQPGLNHPVSYRGRILSLISPEYAIHPDSEKIGKIIHNIALWHASIGIRTNVIIPYSSKLDNINWDQITYNHPHNFCYKEYEGIPVFAIGKDKPFSNVIPPKETGYADLIHFGDALLYFMNLNDYSNHPTALLHFFDYPMGIAMDYISKQLKGNPIASNMIFSPMDPQRNFHKYNMGGMGVGMEKVDGLEMGANVAHSVMFWSDKFYKELQGSHMFYEFLRVTGDKAVKLPGSWQPNVLDNISEKTLREMQEVYMGTLYKKGIDRSIHFMTEPDTKMFMDKVYYFIPEPSDIAKPSRKIVLKDALRHVASDLDNIIVGGLRGVKILGGGRDKDVFYDYWENLGGLTALLEQVIVDNRGRADVDVKGARYLLLADAGDFKRGGVMAQALGIEALKSLTPEGENTLGINCIKQAPIFFRQLPDHGKGWIVFSASDNKWLPDGSPKTGKKYLWESKSKIILTGKPAANVEAVKGLGCWVADEAGKIQLFAEKASPDVVKNALDNLGLAEEDINLNPFVFAIKYDIAEKIVNLYKDTPCKKDGKAFVTTYPLDISSHFIFPTTLKKGEWQRIYEILQQVRKGKVADEVYDEATENGLNLVAIAKGMKKFEKERIGQVFDNLEDWMMIYEMAQKIKLDANDIAGASIGPNCQWNDYGTLEEMIEKMWMAAFDNKEQVRSVARRRTGFPEDNNDMSVDMEQIKTYVTFIDPVTNDVMDLEDGEIPEKVIIQDVNFDHPVQIVADRVILHDVVLGEGVKRIPANTIISRGEIDELEEAPDQPKRISHQPALIFNCHKKGKVIVYRGMAHASLSLAYVDNADLIAQGLHASETPLALSPIYFDLKEEILKQNNYQLYPGINLLEPGLNMLDQSFIIEDENGKPKLLGLNFFQVKSD